MIDISTIDEATLQRLSQLRAILSQRKGKRTAQTVEVLKESGYSPTWKRVTWSGGIGSCKIMRSGKVRVQISATKSGYHRARVGGNGGAFWITSPRFVGYRYALCVEI